MSTAPRKRCRYCRTLMPCSLHAKATRWASMPKDPYYQSGEWKAARAAQLRAHPACAVCGQPATAVDHIIPRSAGGHDHPSNYRSLCRSCHASKTGSDGLAALKAKRRKQRA